MRKLAAFATAKQSDWIHRVDWLRLGIHLLGVSPLFQLVITRLGHRLTANPIQFVEQFLGRAALNLLVCSLAVTPLVTLLGWNALNRHRRTLGLYAFLYFVLHFLTFAILDYGLDWGEILRLALEKPFIVVGALAGLVLLLLAITSFDIWKKKLGKNWKRLHRAVYLASGIVILHYAWALKGSLTNLGGDILKPLGMGLLVGLLLVFRIPVLRRRLAASRFALRRYSVLQKRNE